MKLRSCERGVTESSIPNGGKRAASIQGPASRFQCQRIITFSSSSQPSKMADDTRQSSAQNLNREALNVDPENKAFTGSQWDNKDSKTYQLPENANMMAGGTEHTAGGKAPEVTIWNALHAREDHITEIHKRPCVRDSIMAGMGAGAATGAIRIIWRGNAGRGVLKRQRGY